ncbi:hypothetical protein ACFQ0X_31025 [Streptomyces rectiviolaceus]|uniref:Uncharacterized protein n=1 Tax=Streptomyces rectiviolaceus TaxID=332591 RepID=A0ABP6M5X1_9ACTN
MAAMKRSANGRQLLLLAALLFGIVTMHTLGHPTGHSTGPTTGHPTGHSTAPATAHSTGHSTGDSTSHGSGPEQAAGQHEMSALDSAPPGVPEGTTHAAQAPSPLVAASAPVGMDGMDPLSVCLAVLAALTLVLLLKAGLLRPGGFVVAARPLARLLDGLRPDPPPPRILLAHLSVLRI